MRSRRRFRLHRLRSAPYTRPLWTWFRLLRPRSSSICTAACGSFSCWPWHPTCSLDSSSPFR
ncbi:hypothetical protein SPRG_20881 [Saprolegnia parasitica CBS 223.65]|uniref:Uncharacterized protein n=1 Tax=Saprolegnia parasitica (strain CBS 223.65) TaxID=695850 RepID=A0A067C026_SAPPC|nr:hypothetical protein SPRG_20881 [Saprolegnia parasitica CBS 223.65]KDO23878.1 hypothetical protein SPRG_20881 [Saprolegnia parasitica CBS 223.65]|eukprot:XP_012205409.1 hypothetical protein SPRG_20881 [Saprolegnia parasitica CBS 223.65]